MDTPVAVVEKLNTGEVVQWRDTDAGQIVTWLENPASEKRGGRWYVDIEGGGDSPMNDGDYIVKRLVGRPVRLSPSQYPLRWQPTA